MSVVVLSVWERILTVSAGMSQLCGFCLFSGLFSTPFSAPICGRQAQWRHPLPALWPWSISLAFLGFLRPGQWGLSFLRKCRFHVQSADEGLWKVSSIQAKGYFFPLAFHHFMSMANFKEGEYSGHVFSSTTFGQKLKCLSTKPVWAKAFCINSRTH